MLDTVHMSGCSSCQEYAKGGIVTKPILAAIINDMGNPMPSYIPSCMIKEGAPIVVIQTEKPRELSKVLRGKELCKEKSDV